MKMRVSRGAVVMMAALGLFGCDRESQLGPERRTQGARSALPAASPRQTNAAIHRVGDPERGERLVAKFECHRCHDGTTQSAMADEKHCAHCHDNIVSGRVHAPADVLHRWKAKTADLRDVPSLTAIGARFRPEWLERFLREPHDLRPNLIYSMPRLAISPEDARDLAAHLTKDAGTERDTSFESASTESGRRLFEEKSCGHCHSFTGTDAPGPRPSLTSASAAEADRRAIALAPDLRVTRERFRRDALVAWLMDPVKIKPDTRMPNHSLAPDEARALARFIVETPLAPIATNKSPALPPLLDRRVTFTEVQERVLGVTCGHCHGNANAFAGDGGPGNIGGFGFAPKRLDLTSYTGVAAGYVDENGQRQSVFAATPDGTPRLVAALMARHSEESDSASADVRGMPLGLPSVPLEDIQLVATWIAQGRPR